MKGVTGKNCVTEDILQQILQLYEVHQVAKTVGDILNISEITVLYHLRKHNVKHIRGNHKRDHLIEGAVNYYINNVVNLHDIVSKYGFSVNYFKKILRERNIGIRQLNKSIILNDAYKYVFDNAQSIYNEYEQCKNWSILSKKYLVRPSGIKSVLKYAGFIIHSKAKISKENLRNLQSENIIEEYIKGMSCAELAKKYNVSVYRIQLIIPRDIKRSAPIATSLRNSNEELTRKKLKLSYRRKKCILPSGTCIYVQGYEDDFVHFVLKNTLLTEDDILQTPPVFQYIDHVEKQRRYYPDFYIPKLNLIVEIKSAYTLKKTPPEKGAAVVNSKYQYIVIVDKDYTAFKRIAHQFLRY